MAFKTFLASKLSKLLGLQLPSRFSGVSGRFCFPSFLNFLSRASFLGNLIFPSSLSPHYHFHIFAFSLLVKPWASSAFQTWKGYPVSQALLADTGLQAMGSSKAIKMFTYALFIFLSLKYPSFRGFLFLSCMPVPDLWLLGYQFLWASDFAQVVWVVVWPFSHFAASGKI